MNVKEIVKVPSIAGVFSKMKRRRFPIFLIVVILAAILYLFKNQFVVATVNGKPISRLTLISELEKQSGKQTLEGLITKTLSLQEAKKQNVIIGDEEIGKEIEQIEKNLVSQGQSLDQVLGAQGMEKDELREKIKLQKIVEKIVGGSVSVTDEEVSDYLEKNKDSIPQDLNIEEVKATIKEQLKQQKMNEEIQVWLESLRNTARINYLRFAE